MVRILDSRSSCQGFSPGGELLLVFLGKTLKWLKIVSSTYILMDCSNHSISLDATIMVSKTAQPLVNTLLPFS